MPKQQPIPVRVMAALSMPRLAFTDNMFSVMNLLRMNIEVRKHTGAFWEQSLSRLLYQAVDEGYDYVLTVDYDTLFDPADAFHLIRLMADTSDAAAIFPVQYRREADQILCGMEQGADGVVDASVLDSELSPAMIGHFGLTVLRVDALKRLPHPWLWSQPNADGMWLDEKQDADIYFWNKLRTNGMTAYQANRVVVGHLQQLATWPGADYQPEHQYVTEYHERGRPASMEVQPA